MKVAITIIMDDEDRTALARVVFLRKGLAKRTEVVQWLTMLMDHSLAVSQLRYKRWLANPDTEQSAFPWAIEVDPESLKMPAKMKALASDAKDDKSSEIQKAGQAVPENPEAQVQG